MVLNADKTHLMLLGTDNKTRSAGDTHVTMSNTVITKTSTENLLGCYIDQNLTWKTHIKELSSKLKKRLGCLSQLKFVQKLESRK